ncbi:MAG TPA: hypothetical protein VFG11_08005 [Acidobacteriota bacterium]|nr:hypothetical protein [Acidobacteriota bacterium]
MAERKIGEVIYWQYLSPGLAIFRLKPLDGSRFPDYKAGQYMALRREDCLLTKKIGVDEEGEPIYGPDLDENGKQKVGPVTHSYSLSSAPYETVVNAWIEFYVILERDESGNPGRLTESLFHIHPPEDSKIGYVDRITGDFTLDKRATGFRNVILIGTGTGLAPFAGMIKQLHHDAATSGKVDANVRFTLIHTNRVRAELAYHDELLKIEADQRFDFCYVPSVSRPTEQDFNDPKMGIGRANNLFRFLFELPLREEEVVERLSRNGKSLQSAKQTLDRTVRPRLASNFSIDKIRSRFEPAENTVVLTCGNPHSMEDIRLTADRNRIHFEKEDW